MSGNAYSKAVITILEFADSVPHRPGLYFGVGLNDPRLATRVLTAVLGHGLHPAAALAPVHTPHVVAEVHGDLAFTVRDDQVDLLPEDPRDPAGLGHHGSLLGPCRWYAAAAAALSARTTVEVWRDGRGLRQHLARLRPVTDAEPFDPPPGAGTRVAFDLDPAYFGTGPVADLGGLDLHGPDCEDVGGPGVLVLRDLRGEPREHRYS